MVSCRYLVIQTRSAFDLFSAQSWIWTETLYLMYVCLTFTIYQCKQQIQMFLSSSHLVILQHVLLLILSRYLYLSG